MGTVAAGDVFVLAQSSADAPILAHADQTNGSGWFNGDDAVVMRKVNVAIDSIGQVGFDPGSEWGSGPTSTADNTLRRKAAIAAGDTDSSDAFVPSLGWEGFATNAFDDLGSHGSASDDDLDTGVPPSQCNLPHTPIAAIQGSGQTAAITGTVTTQGVVVGDFEGPSPALRGFYLQGPAGDGDVATSDGIFVFNGNNDLVSLGDLVRVTGNAGEFQGQTQISSTA